MTNPLPEISANTLSTKNSVTIKFQPLAEETNGMTFFVPMPTETYNGFSITIKDKDGKTLSSYTTGTTNTLKRHDLALYTDLELTNGYYVKLKEAGTLASILGDDMLNIKALKITGPLNGDDIKTLRQMLATPEFNDLLKGNLNILDLSEAIIVAGGRSYNESYTTVDNEIGKYMFRNAYNLREIILPNSVTAIRGDALACCYYLTKVTIGDNVTTIGWDAFNGCNITSIIIPNSVIEIEPFAFSYCELLTNLTIGNSVTTIGWNAFQYCSSLTNVTIPNSVTTIGEEAFEGCSKLTEVTCHATTPPTLGSEAFIVAIALRVPKGTKSLYEATDWKNYFVNIVESSE